jgi:hypothetical protein
MSWREIQLASMVLYPRSVSNAVVATAPNRIEASDTDEWRESRRRNFHFLALSFAENEWSRGDGQVVVRRHLRSSKQESLRALRDFYCKSAELAPHWSLSRSRYADTESETGSSLSWPSCTTVLRHSFPFPYYASLPRCMAAIERPVDVTARRGLHHHLPRQPCQHPHSLEQIILPRTMNVCNGLEEPRYLKFARADETTSEGKPLLNRYSTQITREHDFPGAQASLLRLAIFALSHRL